MSIESCETKRPAHAWHAVTAVLATLLVTGCGLDGADDTHVEALEQEPPCTLMDASLGDTGADAGAPGDGGDAKMGDAAPATGPRRVVSDPGGSYFADVTANGTGCPAGTWDAQLSPDGQRVTLTFSAFEAEVDPQREVSIMNCQIALKLVSPQGLSFSVQKFYQAGYAYLEEGVNARVTSSYYLQGSPADNQPPETTFVGPKDARYVIEDTRTQVESEPAWSPCGVDRNLNINTTLRLLNTNNPRRRGYINLARAFGLELAWRRCSQ